MLRDKFVKTSPLEVICMDETKLDSSFPNSQVRTDRYIFIPYRRDRDNHKGAK